VLKDKITCSEGSSCQKKVCYYSKDIFNNQESIKESGVFQIDKQKPVCVVNPLPEYSNKTFNISWNVTDFNGSGINKTEILWKTNTTDWANIIELCSISCSSALCEGDYGTTYYFKCRATDNVGNIGYFSNIVNTTTANPTGTFIEHLPQWIGPKREQWVNGTFKIRWGGEFSTAPLKCYNVFWTDEYSNNPSDWKPLKINESVCIPPEITETIFDESLEEGKTYYFTIRGIDILSNQEPWINLSKESDKQRITNTTIDTSPPSINLTAYDQNGNPLGPVTSSKNITKVNITSSAIDSTSGIKNHTIYVYIIEQGVETLYEINCPSTKGNVTSSCSQTFDVVEGMEIKYKSVAFDNAENEKISSEGAWNFIYTNILANFVPKNVFISTGSYYDAKVYVRNLQNKEDNITVVLSGYTPAKFKGSVFATSEYKISADGRNLTITNIKPYTEDVFILEITSSIPDIYTLYLNASSGSGLNDSDVMHITTGFPPSFSGLSKLGVVLIIVLALLLYYRKCVSPGSKIYNKYENSGGWNFQMTAF